MKITSFTLSLNKDTPPIEKETNITRYKPPQEKKTVRNKYDPKTRIVYGPYLEKVFYANELAAYLNKAKNTKTIQYEFLKEYNHCYELKRRFKRYKESIGNLQTRYNRRKLYYAQEPVYLLSLRYDEFGYILVSGREYYSQLSFQEAYRRCLDFKIADPRFVPPELIDKLRDRQNSEDPQWIDWTVPPINWIESFEKKIKMEAYNSVKFRIGYTREDTPLDCDL